MDDGPETVERSLALCRAGYAAGTRTIVATPHVNWDYPAVQAATIHERVAEMNRALSAAAIDVRVRSGAEVALSKVAELTDLELRMLRLGAGPFVLVELPNNSGAVGLQNALRVLSDRGHRIVIAHPERCETLVRHLELVRALVEEGILCCVTARTLTGHAGRTARAFAWELLDAQLVHVIASDAHDALRRPPDLAAELDRAGLGPGQIDYFTREMPLAIIEGRPLSVPPVVTQRRRRWLQAFHR